MFNPLWKPQQFCPRSKLRGILDFNSILAYGWRTSPDNRFLSSLIRGAAFRRFSQRIVEGQKAKKVKLLLGDCRIDFVKMPLCVCFRHRLDLAEHSGKVGISRKPIVISFDDARHLGNRRCFQ